MQISANSATAPVATPADPEGPPHARRVETFGDLLPAMVLGDPTPQQLRDMEDHLRRLHGTQSGADALRQLRLVIEQENRYPVFDFNDAARSGLPLLAAVAGSTDAMHTAIQAVAALQRNIPGMLTHRVWDFIQDVQARLHSRLPPAPVATRVDDASQAGQPDGHGFQDQAALWDAMFAAVSGHVGDLLDTHFPNRRRLTPLSDAVERWTGGGTPAASRDWDAIELLARQGRDAQGLQAFKVFLLRLANTPLHACPAQRATVAMWLQEAVHPDRAALRRAAYEACIEGTASCQDNILRTWNRLTTLMVQDDALAGRYAGRLDALYAAGLATFRMQEVEKVAQARILELHAENRRRSQQGVRQLKVDPIETQLAYEVALKAPLALPTVVDAMYFPRLAHVEEKDVEMALAAIRQAEAREFPAYLVIDFEPFMAEVKRQAEPAAWDAATEALYRELESLDRKVAERLQAQGTPATDQAALETSQRIGREIYYAARLPLVNRALGLAGLPALPAHAAAPATSAAPSSS